MGWCILASLLPYRRGCWPDFSPLTSSTSRLLLLSSLSSAPLTLPFFLLAPMALSLHLPQQQVLWLQVTFTVALTLTHLGVSGPRSQPRVSTVRSSPLLFQPHPLLPSPPMPALSPHLLHPPPRVCPASPPLSLPLPPAPPHPPIRGVLGSSPHLTPNTGVDLPQIQDTEPRRSAAGLTPSIAWT